MGVARQAKVEQQHRAIGLDQDVGGLEIQVTDVLPMQAVHRMGHGRADLRHRFKGRERIGLDPVRQGLALHILHDQIGNAGQIAGGHKTRHMRATEGGHDLAFDFEADDVFGAITRRHARDFHGHGKARVAPHAVGIGRIAHLVNVRHATGMHTFHDFKTIHQVAGL